MTQFPEWWFSTLASGGSMTIVSKEWKDFQLAGFHTFSWNGEYYQVTGKSTGGGVYNITAKKRTYEAVVAQSDPYMVKLIESEDSKLLDAIEVLVDKMTETFYATNDDSAKISIASFTMGQVGGLLMRRNKSNG
jgi:hypothetical protein